MPIQSPAEGKPRLVVVTLEDLAATTGQSVRLRRLLPELARHASLTLATRGGNIPESLLAAIDRRIDLPMPPGVSPIGFFFSPRGPWRLARVRRALRRLGGPCVTIYADSVLLGWMMGGCARRALAVEVNGIIAEEYRTKRHPAQRAMLPLLRRWERAGFRAADKLIAVSEGVAAAIGERSGAAAPPIAVIGNGIDPALFNANPATLAAGAELRRLRGWGDAPVGILVSTFRAWHGADQLVRAAGRIRERHPNFRLALVGDGPERAATEQLAGALGIGGAVDFVGAVDPAAVPAWIAAADVGLYFPTPPQGSGDFLFDPIKFYETMAIGKPTVSVRWPHLGAPLVDAEAGLLTDPSPEAFAQAVAGLIGDPAQARAMGARGAQYALAHCTWSSIAYRIAQHIGIGLDPTQTQ